MQTLSTLKYIILVGIITITATFLLPTRKAEAQNIVIYSDACCTRKFWCRVESDRVGSVCQCDTNYGPILGRICTF